MAVALLSAASAHADQSVLTYHGALDRAGRYVVPGLTYERARGLRLDASFHAAFQGKVYAQPLLWRQPGSSEVELIDDVRATVIGLAHPVEFDDVRHFEACSSRQILKNTCAASSAL